MKAKRALVIAALAVGLPQAAFAAADFGAALEDIVAPHRFNLAAWELSVVPGEIGRWAINSCRRVEDGPGVVSRYFAAAQRINSLEREIMILEAAGGQAAPLKEELKGLRALNEADKDTVELVLERQIAAILAEQGILVPNENLAWLNMPIPPVNFALTEPPQLLVVSPRDQIASIRRIYLKQDTDLEEKETVEAAVDDLGVSSLVVRLGGLGATYPSFVADGQSLQYTLEAVAEEWLHQHLVFRPLGMLYLLDQLGFRQDYDIITINETVVGMTAQEISALAMAKYYPQYQPPTASEPDDEGFNFDREMRAIRRTVDGYLAQGMVEEAEEFMEKRRQYILTKGYYIRKLNQAYFAFHGTYAYKGTSVDPIGDELKLLRTRSATLKDFLYRVSIMTSHQDLKQALR